MGAARATPDALADTAWYLAAGPTDRPCEPGMIYLVCIFASPLALLLIGKPIQFVLNLVLWILAVIFAITIIGFIPFGVGFWGVGVLHAVLAVNNHRADKRSRALIEAMKGNRP